MLIEIRFSQMCHQKLVLYENFLEHIVFAIIGDPSPALQRFRDSKWATKRTIPSLFVIPLNRKKKQTNKSNFIIKVSDTLGVSLPFRSALFVLQSSF